MISIKNDREIGLMRRSAKMVAETFEYIEPFVKPGVTTRELDDKIEAFIVDNGGYPAFKGLYGFPASACISIDEEVVHGIPSDKRILEEGQIISIDIGVRIDGYYGDAAYTFPVGEIDDRKRHLMRTTWESLHLGLKNARAGNRLQDISAAIQQHAEKNGYHVVRELVGHGIGKKLHEDPQVPNYGKPGRGVLLKPGITLAVEPMINTGTVTVKTLSDKWTVVTADRLPSAHYEHTVLITDDEPEILTQHQLSP